VNRALARQTSRFVAEVRRGLGESYVARYRIVGPGAPTSGFVFAQSGETTPTMPYSSSFLDVATIGRSTYESVSTARGFFECVRHNLTGSWACDGPNDIELGNGGQSQMLSFDLSSTLWTLLSNPNGTEVGFTTRKAGGFTLTCLRFAALAGPHSSRETFCSTDTGIVAYFAAPGGPAIELAALSISLPSREFALPALPRPWGGFETAWQGYPPALL
jgi:hypothetical protein